MPFIGTDLIPLLQKHISHADEETAIQIKNALMFLAQKGESEASIILEDLQSIKESGKEAEEEPIRLTVKFRELVSQFPAWILGDTSDKLLKHLPYNPIPRIKSLYYHLRKILNIMRF